MFDRVRDWIARGSLPLLLLSLAVLLNPLIEDDSSAGRLRVLTAHRMEELGPIESRVDAQVHMLANSVLESALAAHRHLHYHAILLFVFAVAYLCLARERLALRIPVFAGVLLVAFAAALDHAYIC